MLGKTTQRLLSALVVGMSISSLPIFSLAASAASESSNLGTASVSKSNAKNDAPPAIIMDKTPIDPAKVFDNLYFLGTKGVGAWMVNTSDGIILIDSMNTDKDAEDLIIPGIKKLGFDPANIKYVLVTHGHGDHYGGSKYIQDNYGATILMSAVDWDFMNNNFTGANGPDFPKPTSHTDITDGEKLTLGDTTITIVSTPGHTPGGVSLIIPVTDKGIKHMVGMWGGTGLTASLKDNKKYSNSLDYFAKFTDAAQVDVEITAHTFVDNSAERMETLRNRKSGDANPFVIGQNAYNAYMGKFKANVTDNIEKLSKQTQTNQSQAEITKGWTKNSAGKWLYYDNSSSLTTNTWKQIEEKWYYFDNLSQAVTGWKEINGQWYYFDSSCEAVIGWKEINGKWYYFDGDYAMGYDSYIEGYYLTSSGEMN